MIGLWNEFLIEMTEQQIRELQQRLVELQKTYSERGIPLTALKIAGSRIDEVVSSGERVSPELVYKARLTLDQANMVAGYYSNNLTDAFNLVDEMRRNLHEDYPQHYLVHD